MARTIHLGGGAFHAYIHPRLTALERVGVITAKWDLEGRPSSAQHGDVYYRRGISHAVMARGRLERAGRILPKAEADEALGLFRSLAAGVSDLLRREERPEPELVELGHRVATILATPPERLEEEGRRFLQVYRPVPILPPDRTLAFVVQVTEGCSWNRCSFCGLYPDRVFRIKDADETEEHLRRALALFGKSILLRNSIFFGDGDPFAAGDDALIPVVDRTRRVLDEAAAAGLSLPSTRDLYAFARLSSLAAAGGRDLRPYGARGFRRLYVGVETGDAEIYKLLRKPGSLATVPAAIDRMHEAGIAAGLIFLAGVGGVRHCDAHREATAGLLARLPLGKDDMIFLSPFRVVPGSDYARWAEEEGVAPLTRKEMHREAAEIVRAARRAGVRAKTAYYPLEHFVY